MRVCLIGPSNLSLMPYVRYYEDILQACKVAYDLLYWDREDVPDHENPHGVKFTHRSSGGLSSLRGYLDYRRFVKHYIKHQSYDVYIVFSSQLAFFLYDVLRSKHFILDIRDYSFENVRLYKAAVHSLIRRARLTSISSNGFREWLPPGKEYVLSHNVSLDRLEMEARPFNPETRIVLYIGLIRYFEPTVKFLEGLQQIPEFSIRYIGMGSCLERLRQYCGERNSPNVFFHGAFAPAEKERFYRDTNFVTAVYGTQRSAKTALPNKLYETCRYGRPIIVARGNHLAEIVERNRLGIVVDLENLGNLREQLYWYYDEGNYQEYLRTCERYLQSIREDIHHFRHRVASAMGLKPPVEMEAPVPVETTLSKV